MATAQNEESRASTPFPVRHLLVVVVLAAIYQVFIFLAYPLAPGPDGWTFFVYPEQMFSGHHYAPIVMRLRPPLYPLFLAGLMGVFGDNGLALVLVHHGLAIVFIVLFFLSLVRFGPRFAAMVAGLVAVAPQVMDHFHFCSSEPLYLVLLAAALLSIERFFERRSGPWAIAAGLTLSLAPLCRPVFGPIGYVLLVWLLLKRSRWRVRLALLAAWLVPLAGISTWNYFAQGFFGTQAGTGPTLALAALQEHPVSQFDDGPATRRLYEDLREDFQAGRTEVEWSPRVWRSDEYGDDLLGEAYRLQALRYGFEEAEARLGRVGREAVLNHPVQFAFRVAVQTAKFLRFPSRLMRSWFFEARPGYAAPQPVEKLAPSRYEEWVYTRPWPAVDEASRDRMVDRVYHFRHEIWAARPVGNALLLSALQEWERMVLLPGLWLAVFSIAALVLLWRTRHRDVLLVYALIVLGHALVTSVALHVSNRYVAVILPWYIAAAALGIRAAFLRSVRSAARQTGDSPDCGPAAATGTGTEGPPPSPPDMR